MKRCTWVTNDPQYIQYHDEEWGRPEYNSQKLFEALCLEGQQAGLSWITILKKRNNYRQLFDHFDPYKIKDYDAEKIDQLVEDPGIIRYRLKVEAIIKNAKAYVHIMEETDQSFSKYLWNFVGGQPIDHQVPAGGSPPSQTEISTKMSKQLKKDGFSFVGPTTCYAFMQAVGMVNDHEDGCAFRNV